MNAKPMTPTPMNPSSPETGRTREIRRSLLDRRDELLSQALRLRWEKGETLPRPAELEEEAQLDRVQAVQNLLDDRAVQELEDLDLALARLNSGRYGLCEGCRETISPRRLKAVPAARLCLSCAERFELESRTLVPARQVLELVETTDEHRDLPDGQLQEEILDRLEQDDRLDLEEVSVSVSDGVVYLDGSVPSRPQRQLVDKTLTDVLGFTAVVDRLRVEERTRDEIPAGADLREEPADPEREGARRRLAHEEDRLSVDPLEAREEEVPLVPADRPIPEPPES